MFNASRRLNFLGPAIIYPASILVSSASCNSAEPKINHHHTPVVASYPANNPVEDRYAVHAPEDPTAWKLFTIFDGHGGWQMAEFSHKALIPEISKQYEKQKTYISYFTDAQRVKKHDSFENIQNVIHSAFAAVEAEYMEKTLDAFKLGFGELAKVGCCVLLAMRKDNQLVIANCGDCRAVMGTSVCPPVAVKDELFEQNHLQNHRHVATRLTHDHNARVPLEALRLSIAHPNESDLIVCKSEHACYVKGRLQLTRSLGDAYLKNREFNGPPNSHRSWGRHIPNPYTPPYVSPIPEITRVRLDVGDDFLILATDGLWDELSDQDAVSIVSQCCASGQKDSAAKVLVERALEHAAQEAGMTIEALRSLPPGSRRRSRHDDTTAVVVFL